MPRHALLCLLAIVPACVADTNENADQSEVGGTSYVDVIDFAGIDQGAWYDLEAALRDQFSSTCAGSYCQGTYRNLTALSFNCSVTSKLGVVHDCAWTLAGSRTEIDPATAAISVDAVTFECHLHPKTTAKKLLALLGSSADPMHEPLPGGGTIDSAVADCMAHPIGSTPLPVPSSSPLTYVSADDYYTSAAYQQKWAGAVAAAVRGFDNICGDTFCGSDFGDLRSLDLQCAVTKSTGNVKSCAWVFGGSYALPASSGALAETSRTFRCDFTMHGTLSQLIATWSAAGYDDPIQRALPGVTATAYDALGGCLP
jgi:hypothetical protein